jgi:hypothetical protein
MPNIDIKDCAVKEDIVIRISRCNSTCDTSLEADKITDALERVSLELYRKIVSNLIANELKDGSFIKTKLEKQ